MYPFEIVIDRHVFACLNTFTEQGYERTRIEFWYPSFHFCTLPKGTNFVTAEPSYPDITAPWHRQRSDFEFWDEIPF